MGIRGVNMGNWLVLEKWMGNSPLASASAQDDHDLIDEMSPEKRGDALMSHYDTYVREDDFAWLAKVGVNLIRIPIPYHLFGTPHHPPCIRALDRAFEWAEAHGLAILLDLHTVPMSQNASDNGGYMGICAWHRDPERIDFVLGTLERLAVRYASSTALWGIEPLNEPASVPVFAAHLIRYGKRHRKRILRSRPLTRTCLKRFYTQVYERIHPLVGPEVKLVFHDQFDLAGWDDWCLGDDENVWIDTHQYLFFNDRPLRRHDLADYLSAARRRGIAVKRAARHHHVLVGEWSLANRSRELHALSEAERRTWYRSYADAQLDAWDQGDGCCFWSYRNDSKGRQDWSLRSCIEHGWIDLRYREAPWKGQARRHDARRDEMASP